GAGAVPDDPRPATSAEDSTWKLDASPTTCALVTISPLASSTTPDPSPALVRISTTEGRTRLMALTSSCCSAAATRRASAGPESAAAEPEAPGTVSSAAGTGAVPEEHPASRQAASAGPSAAAMRTLRFFGKGPGTREPGMPLLLAADRSRVEGEAGTGDAQ